MGDNEVIDGLRGLATRACEARLRYLSEDKPRLKVSSGQRDRQMADLWGWCEAMTRLALKLAEDDSAPELERLRSKLAQAATDLEDVEREARSRTYLRGEPLEMLASVIADLRREEPTDG